MRKVFLGLVALSTFSIFASNIQRLDVANRDIKSRDDKSTVPKLYFLEEGDRLEVERGRTTAIFNKKTGLLEYLILKGGVVVFDEPFKGAITSPHLTCVRPFVDNDKNEKAFFDSGFAKFTYRPKLFNKVDDKQNLSAELSSNNSKTFEIKENSVKSVFDVIGDNGAHLVHECEYCFNEDGSITLKNTVTAHGTKPKFLPRFGLSMKISPRFENMRYWGCNIIENAENSTVDKSSVGIYDSTVTKQFIEGAKSYKSSYKTDVKWVEFTDKYARGVRFSGSVPLYIQALHYTWEDIQKMRVKSEGTQAESLIKPRRDIILNLDVRQSDFDDSTNLLPKFPIKWSITIGRNKVSK